MQKMHLHFVVARTQTAVKGYAVNPVAKVGLLNATANHAFKIDR